jgi:MFS transporter, DHA1 family, multidrug resistance protein
MILWLGSFAVSAGMSLVVPFLSVFIEQLGVKNIGQVEQLNGIAFAITFLAGAALSTFWGHLADRRGRKLVLMISGLGLSLINLLYLFTPNVYVLIFFRLLQGLFSGYIPAANAFVAKETPGNKSGWALATLSTGMVTGNLFGPILGGFLDELLGIRNVFIVTACFLFVAFLLTRFFLKELDVPFEAKGTENQIERDAPLQLKKGTAFAEIAPKKLNLKLIFGLCVSACLLNTANMSIEPIATIFVRQLLKNSPELGTHIGLFSGLVISATGLGILLSASKIGKLADRIGYTPVLFLSVLLTTIVFIPMSFVHFAWQLMVLRFLLGITQAGIMPMISTLLKLASPPESIGQVFGYNQAAGMLGLVFGPLLGGQLSAYFGFTNIFFVSAAIMLIQLFVLVFSLRGSRKKAGLSKNKAA